MKINADAAGLDGARLERITEHLTARYIEPQKIAGCQVAVARRGELGYFRSLGSMDLERSKPVQDDTIWRIYSMTKPVTSVALMTLYERGLFQLDDPVSRFLPEMGGMEVAEVEKGAIVRTRPPARPMQVRDVLMHTAGIGYGGLLGLEAADPIDKLYAEAGVAAVSLGGPKQASLAELIEALGTVPLKFDPGTRWHYSFATDVCARLVEVLSGEKFSDYLRTTMFEPLGMVDTGFVVADGDLDRFAANYGRRRDKTLKLLDDPERSVYRKEGRLESGGGGLVSTTADYLRFCQMLLNGGELDGARVLGRKTIELMASNHLPGGGDLATLAIGGFSETKYEGVGFGLGFAVGQGPVAQRTVGSAGEYFWGGAASTIFWIDPVEELIVVFMTQLFPSTTFDFRGQLKTLVYPAIVD